MASWEYFDRPASAVESNLSVMNSRADEALAAANAAISALSDVGLDVAPNPPNLQLPDIAVPAVVEPQRPTGQNFGTIYTPQTPTFQDLSSLLGVSLSDLDIDVAEFSPTTGAINMPAAPAPINTSGLPSRPTTTDVTIPVAPDVVLPTLANLTELSIPTFTFPDLPTFDGTEPTFDEARPSTALIWAEPEYDSDLLDDVTAKVRSWLQGGTGLPAAVQQALFDRARGRELFTALEAQQTAFDAFSAKGFSMPPGMLAEQVNVAVEKSRLAQNVLSRDILIESAKWEIENLRFAIEKGIALETVLIGKFMEFAKRTFEAARFQVESEINVFNAMVSVYNAKQQGYRTAAEVFKIRIDGELAKLRVFEAEIQAEIAKGQLNEQKVREYEARLKATMSLIDIYKAKMEGARIQSDVARNQIEGYKADVQAYAERLDAEKKRFDAYEAQVRAESAKAGALEAEARAYAATVQAQEAKANVKVAYINAKLGVFRASIEKFLASVENEKALVQASLGAIEAGARAYLADVERYRAEIQGETAAAEVTLRVAEDRTRNIIAYFDAQSKQYDTMTNRIVKEAEIVLGALEAAARSSSALAQGALSAIHVQASMSGSGSVSDSQSYSVQVQRKGANVA
jgi:hypothetical protein